MLYLTIQLKDSHSFKFLAYFSKGKVEKPEKSSGNEMMNLKFELESIIEVNFL